MTIPAKQVGHIGFDFLIDARQVIHCLNETSWKLESKIQWQFLQMITLPWIKDCHDYTLLDFLNILLEYPNICTKIS